MRRSPRRSPADRHQGILRQLRKRVRQLAIDVDPGAGRSDHQAVRSDQKLLIPSRGCLVVPARDQQPGQLIEIADGDDDALVAVLVDDRGARDEAAQFMLDQDLGFIFEPVRQIDGRGVGLQVHQGSALLVLVEDPLVDRRPAQDLLLDLSAKTLLDGIEVGVQPILQRHPQGQS
jgi:hypothetical protein